MYSKGKPNYLYVYKLFCVEKLYKRFEMQKITRRQNENKMIKKNGQ